jgi:HEPN domain-containing protein
VFRAADGAQTYAKTKTMTNEQKVQHWVAISDEDLSAGTTLLQGGHYLYVAFMCQQCIEKIFKAAYTKLKEDTPPFVHDIRHLAKICGIDPTLSDEQKLFIAEINPMNIEARYPEYKSRIAKMLSHTKCESLLAQTKNLQQWIKETILSTK